MLVLENFIDVVQSIYLVTDLWQYLSHLTGEMNVNDPCRLRDYIVNKINNSMITSIILHKLVPNGFIVAYQFMPYVMLNRSTRVFIITPYDNKYIYPFPFFFKFPGSDIMSFIESCGSQ